VGGEVQPGFSPVVAVLYGRWPAPQPVSQVG